MAILTNPFIDVVNSLNGLSTPPIPRQESDTLADIRRQREVALFITMHQVLDQVDQLLAPGEKIINLLPMTNEDNSGYATDGVFGMYVPQTEATKDYRDAQFSLRGNRLMVFTDRRIIFFIVIEFLDNPKQYFSYEYTHIKYVKLAAKRVRAEDPKHLGKPQYYGYYSFDFETTDKHVFTEFLTQENGELFKHNLLTIPGMKDIQIGDKVKRFTLFDQMFSNTSLSYKIALIVAVILVGGNLLGAFINWLLGL